MKWLLVFLVVSPAYAVTWTEYARDADLNSYAYTADLITHHDNKGRVLVVWTRRSGFAGQDSKSQYEIHCASRSVRLTQEIRLNGAGQVAYRLNDPGARWQRTIPDSMEQVLVDATCPYYR
jgi:hypothetical protein